MWTHRVLYQFTILCSLFFYVLYPRWFSWYLLVLILFLIPFDLIISLPGMLTKRAVLAAPRILKQGEDGMLSVVNLHRRWFPAGCIKVRLREISDGDVILHRLKCESERGSLREMAINTSRSGFTAFEIDRLSATSLIGLFSIPVAAESRAGVLILPAPIKPPNGVSLPRVSALRPEQSGIFSEDHDLRPYRPGDPLKSVHWKLSAKYDSLIVREPLLPPPHRRMVYISQWNNAQERNVALGRLQWVSDYLLEKDLHFYLRLGNSGPIAEITKNGDLIDYLYHVLDEKAPPLQNPVIPPRRFTWAFRIDGNRNSVNSEFGMRNAE